MPNKSQQQLGWAKETSRVTDAFQALKPPKTHPGSCQESSEHRHCAEFGRTEGVAGPCVGFNPDFHPI